jgi:ribosomal protein L18E
MIKKRNVFEKRINYRKLKQNSVMWLKKDDTVIYVYVLSKDTEKRKVNVHALTYSNGKNTADRNLTLDYDALQYEVSRIPEYWILY